MEKANKTAIYYARYYEMKKERQNPLFQEDEEGNSLKYVPVPVPTKWVTGSGSKVIALFHKGGKNIVCPHFWELKAWIGCPFECSYCYLQGTFRGAERKKPKMKKEDDIKRYMEEFLSWADDAGLITLLNSGELADSLAIPNFVRKLIEIATPLLRNHPDHMILLLSKGGENHVKVLEDVPEDLRKRFIASFSINPQVIVDRYERGTASTESRIKAAEIAGDMGFRVRIRIDPIVPVAAGGESWIFHYEMLIEELLNKVKPEIITLGSLRALKKTIHYASDKSWLEYTSEESPWGKRVKNRQKIYKLIIELLRDKGFNGKVGLCKETLGVWEYLKREGLMEDPGEPGVWENVMCNCKLSNPT
jgi:spore photoproduct lyase